MNHVKQILSGWFYAHRTLSTAIILFTVLLALALIPFGFRFQSSEIVFLIMRDSPVWALLAASFSALVLLFNFRRFSRAELLGLMIFFSFLPFTLVLDDGQAQWIIWTYLPALAAPYWIAALAAFWGRPLKAADDNNEFV